MSTFERKNKKGLRKQKKKHTNTLIDSKNFNVEMHRSYEEEEKDLEVSNFLRNHTL